MIIVNAEFPAGLTIERAIADALTFSKANHCMVKAEINDIPMTFVYDDIFGKTFDEMIAYYAGEYRHRLNENEEGRKMGESFAPIRVRRLRNGDVRLESSNRHVVEEVVKLLTPHGSPLREVFDTEARDVDGRVFCALFTEDEMAVVGDDRTFVSDCAVIKMSLIEWAEDDIGQYEKRGFPRHLEGWYVPVSMLSKSDEEIGDYLMNELGKAYGKSPVLILWDLDKDKE